MSYDHELERIEAEIAAGAAYQVKAGEFWDVLLWQLDWDRERWLMMVASQLQFEAAEPQKGEDMNEPKHIRFVKVENWPGPTQRWHVVNKHSGDRLGIIAWHAKWKQFVFGTFMEMSCDFSADCLRDIAQFCEKEKMTPTTPRHGLSTSRSR